jgi:hypothetical protein
MAVPGSLTFKEIQDLALDQLQEVQASPDFTLKKLKRYINLGYNDLTRRTRAFTSSYDITTVANQESYDDIKEGAFYHVTHARYIEDSTTEYGDPLRLWPGGFGGLPKDKEFGNPYYYWIRYGGDNTAQELGTVPIAATASKTITVFGYNLPTALSADADIPIIHEAYHEGLFQYPVWKICNAYAHKSKAIREKAIVARGEYLDIVNSAKRDAEDFIGDDIQTIDVYSRGYWEEF